jgi:hypothetical protein
MRRRDTLAEVEMTGERITRVHCGRRVYRVERLLEAWVVQGRWWGCEERREYVRLLTDRATIEVYRSGATWHLARVVD